MRPARRSRSEAVIRHLRGSDRAALPRLRIAAPSGDPLRPSPNQLRATDFRPFSVLWACSYFLPSREDAPALGFETRKGRPSALGSPDCTTVLSSVANSAQWP